MALCGSVLALAGTGIALAQDSTAATSTTTTTSTSGTPPPGEGPGGHHHHMWGDKVLTADEQAELKKDTDQVMTADPDLKKEGDDMRGQMPAKDASEADKQAFHEKMHDHMEKVRAAIEKIDPDAAALFAKMDAARKAHEAAKDGGQ
jgi:Spy/CpxP family protein refolding chaperone